MKYVVMVSHGEFAPGLHSAVKMMTGDREDVLSTSLKDGMSADEFASNFAELVKDFKADDQVILLADILSGSPFTNALNVLVRGTWRILTTGSPIKSSVYGRVGMILL